MKSESYRYTPSLGARALAAAPGTLRAKAEAARCSERALSNYLNGARVPNDAIAGRLEAAFGIERCAWQEAAPAAPGAVLAAPESTEAAPMPAGIEAVQAQLQRLRERREKGNLSARECLESEKLEAALHRDLDRLRGITLDQIFASSHFESLLADLEAALHDRPWALSVALSALENSSEAVDGMRADHPELVAAVEAAENALLKACERAARRAS